MPMTWHWPVLLAVFAGAYLLVNLAFAAVYLAVGDAILGVPPRLVRGRHHGRKGR
jgi:hypothetical protein